MPAAYNHIAIKCWKCGTDHEVAMFCPACHTIQTPSSAPDYFVYLGIGESFDIDSTQLEKNYFALQQQLHPDRFAGKSEQERTLSLQHSMTANEAYNTLKDPFKRGEYLLERQGVIVRDGKDSIKPSQATLIAMMELREQLEEATTAEAIKNITTDVENEKKQVLQNLSACFAEQDYNKAAQEVIRLRYLDKTQEEIKIKRRTIQAA